MANVVSAAVVSGELIIGLSDGSIVRCGYVQGPQGLKGDQGPMGATGPAGVDGNTLHTVEGIPDGSLGKDGDFCIDRILWRISGPKAGGRWPQFVDMLAKGKGKKLGEKGSAGFGVTGGGGSSGGSGPGGDVFTNQVLASGTGRLIEVPVVGSTRVQVQYPGSPNGIIPPSGRLGYQSSINGFFVDALDQLDLAIPVPTTDDPPTADIYEGKLWFDTGEGELTLYIRYGGDWVPAAPPVSLDGIKTAIANIDEQLLTINRNVAINKSEVDEGLLDVQTAQDAQDVKIEALETSQGEQDSRLDAVEGLANTAKDTADAATNALDSAAFVNQDNTFSSSKTNTFKGDVSSEKQLTIAAPSNTNYNPTFQIKGTARTGTVNSVVLRATQSDSRMRVTYRGPIDSDDEITTRKYVEDRLGGDKPDGPKAWRYIPIEKWNPGSLETGTFTIDKDNAKIYLNCHDEDGNWWVYRTRTETYSTPQPHFTVYAASGTMVWDASVHIADFYKVVNDQRITALEYSSASSYYWNNYFKENHYFVIHFLSYLPNFRERHLEKLNPVDSAFSLPDEPDGLQLDQIEVQE